MKKLLFNKSMMLCLVMLAGYCVNVTAQNFTVGGINYAVNDDKKTVTVGENENVDGQLNIPATVTYNKMTYSVAEIGYRAFEGCSGLTQVTIPNSVTEIGDRAFKSCRGLTSVTIPNSVTEIGVGAFDGCSGLTEVTIPNSVTEIGLGAFYGCSGLTQVTIPNSVAEIGGSAFYGCSGLTQVTIPNSVTSIGNSAFEGTPWYNNQPDGLVYAGMVAYQYKGTMPQGTTIILKNGCTGIAGFCFWYCSGLTHVSIPNSVTEIGSHAFYHCSGLTHVTIPNSVTEIGYGAFRDCSGLTEVSAPKWLAGDKDEMEGVFGDFNGTVKVNK